VARHKGGCHGLGRKKTADPIPGNLKRATTAGVSRDKKSAKRGLVPGVGFKTTGSGLKGFLVATASKRPTKDPWDRGQGAKKG